ncbi:Arginine-tRNA ligase [Candidatus Saccharibacteria bacterium RAAC3_TM7_1]|nr:Arginine-tRNA ligase [Candidatus Saccharibacteria bacterium RAAC3_TM7_1]HCZ28731.1 arginine--tRNA ligase [Candidatus Saccharibacteria bacterium]
METIIANVVRNLYDADIEIQLTRPEPKFGDYATNVALQLAKPLGKNPRELAEKIATTLRESGDFKAVEVAGPGFINLTLSDEALLAEAEQLPLLLRRGQKVVIETNNPNPFKAMHIGHAMNAIVADTVANLIEGSGAETHRVSYHGDIGLHVGKSMYSLLRYVDGDITRLMTMPDTEHNSFMSRMYAEGSHAYKEDEAARAEIDELARQSFTQDDPLYAQVYDICKNWSFNQIDEIVGLLGNVPIEKRYLESEADARGVPTVKAHVPDVFVESDGALVFEGSKYGAFDNVFVTKRGLGLYGARDLGLMQLKNDDYHAEKSYIVTAEEQRDYFKGVIAAAELCLPELKDVTVNISTGTVKLTTGKMSSRSGEVVEISWLFEQVAQAIRTRGGEPTDELIAGALRYQFLKVHIGGDIVFDINEAVSLQGNTGSYLQYAYARAHSIITKSTADASKPETLTESERLLVRKISEYGLTVGRAMNELAPHGICTYLYELAQEFNRFYEKERIIGDTRESERRYIVKQYMDTLARGLRLLGIIAPETM